MCGNNILMSKRFRGNDGVGYAPNSFNTIPPAAVVSNARLELVNLDSLRANNPNPLWPHAKTDHPKFLPARKGIIGFAVMAQDDVKLNAIVGNSSEAPSFYKQMSAFNLELDSIGYYSQLNSLGVRPTGTGSDTIYNAQRSFLRAVRPLGIIVSDIENASNLRHLGNTLMHSFGKLTIPNVGCNDIDQYTTISADVATERDIDKYGLRKIDSFEPDCFTLVPTPTKTISNTLEHITQYLEDDFRNRAHADGVLRMIRGCLNISAAISAKNSMSEAIEHIPVPAVAVPPGTSPDTYSYSQAAFIAANRLAILGVDEEYDKDFMDTIEGLRKNVSTGPSAKYKTDSLLYSYPMNTNKHSEHLSKLITDVSNDNVAIQFRNNNPQVFAPNVIDTLSDVFDIHRGIRDVVYGLSDIMVVSQSLKIGIAVTPASVGRDFDLVIQM